MLKACFKSFFHRLETISSMLGVIRIEFNCFPKLFSDSCNNFHDFNSQNVLKIWNFNNLRISKGYGKTGSLHAFTDGISKSQKPFQFDNAKIKESLIRP